ncbi:kdo(2)-lipid IV(A) palmitoleoyltransferase [Pluralibacter gergoviae]|mgnify:FL=1|uniref:Lipid A biosynthesis acyltransferase n=1 Tax=Pluralibacter gergoviae TaxID=61647 RepID=A0A089PSB0_PLUGE|nr:kdo(2)-lipid IV(A) palmitoleoyltransferase [Pluralibacter gergoviae]AIR01189.1 lipid A biosynthesis palmitoleoyl acyltransferase [Pluralibacter gergoviae]EKV0916486.1 kdo(2)-lipid IV(A) palmitoleoyltransferase [Pluralibacter gergoviae]EKV0931400.1 kdo(2)-lipid IV(A) palmitoleoyltransferase [Pluralibacter gergoviae]EKV6247844.1 kdo(2)-lipid IV(A) palmitoleoyltransferase [Pluralibacter gergoviae]EKV9909845.1 kdo(2)-lipid IV(A) palmitoleoyltransferase [Pluralibacter gergoviae]
MNKFFDLSLLHPRNWLTWLGLGVLWLLVQLPYPLLHIIGSSLGRAARPFLKRREKIAARNIALCFPEMNAADKETLLEQNFVSLGMGLIETGMAWFWSDARVKKWFDVEGYANLTNALAENRGVMVVGVHFMSLELGGRAMGLCRPMMATYRRHNSPLMEWVQTRGRLRSNKAMIDRRNLRGLVQALKAGEAVWFAPDQDYGPKGSTFAPFFSVPQAATTNGTRVLSRLSGAGLLTITMVRKANRRGYSLHISESITDYPKDDELAAASYMNRVIEKEILRAPEQYLWVHRRFKTRPLGEASLY